MKLNIDAATKAIRKGAEEAVVEAFQDCLKKLLTADFSTRSGRTKALMLVDAANDQLACAKRLGIAGALQIEPLPMGFCFWNWQDREERIRRLLEFLQ